MKTQLCPHNISMKTHKRTINPSLSSVTLILDNGCIYIFFTCVSCPWGLAKMGWKWFIRCTLQLHSSFLFSFLKNVLHPILKLLSAMKIWSLTCFMLEIIITKWMNNIFPYNLTTDDICYIARKILKEIQKVGETCVCKILSILLYDIILKNQH